MAPLLCATNSTTAASVSRLLGTLAWPENTRLRSHVHHRLGPGRTAVGRVHGKNVVLVRVDKPLRCIAVNLNVQIVNALRHHRTAPSTSVIAPTKSRFIR